MFESDRIYFDEETHLYFDKETGKHLVSPTQIIKSYSHPFDPDGKIAERIAQREGVTKDEMQAKWRQMGVDAGVRGHSIHDSFEKYIKTGNVQEDENKDIIEDFVQKVPTEGALHPEVTLYDLRHGIAGRTDLVEIWWENIVNVFDFKTNKKINKYSFGKNMLYPLNHLPDSLYSKYECQLSLYALMLEAKGFCPRNLTLLWVNPKREIQIMPVKYRRTDMINMLKHYENRKK
jgi:hypothetical protein